MVLIKRRATLSSVSITSAATRGSYYLPFGDNVTPKNQKPSPESVSPESGSRRSFSFANHHHHPYNNKNINGKDNKYVVAKRFVLPSWLYRVIAASVALWWIGSQYWSKSYSNGNISSSRSQQQQTSPLETDVLTNPGSSSSTTFRKPGLDNDSVPKLQRSHHAVETDYVQDDVASPIQQQDKQEHGFIIDRWIEHRMTVLEKKVAKLQSHVQEESRKQVLAKYGPGPTYRVKFTVELVRSKAVKFFVVEMAPLDLVPHSVYMFLESVQHGLWDNTVFWHHDDIDHVISSATVIYSTGQPNHQYFHALGVGSVSFAEYSSLYPHEKYTLGFANRGPVFYINSMNNTILHGPGGQGHHDLPDEADPCFGKVVEGWDVVDEMIRVSSSQQQELPPSSKKGKQRQEDWHAYDLTHILRAEVI